MPYLERYHLAPLQVVVVLITEVQECIQAHSMLLPGARVVVAVSGGADSMALLAALVHLTPAYKLSLHVAHINHQLRGSEAERDALFVAKQARHFKLSFHQQRIDIAALQRCKHLSLQHAARELRYRFLFSLRRALNATHVALGHTQDDQAETLLMRLVRGSSPEGLAGIPAVRDCLVRPLIWSRRQTISRYLRDMCLPWVEDSSNRHTLYIRNHIRHSLLPTLLHDNPRLPERLGELAEMLQANNEELCRSTTRWDHSVLERCPGSRFLLKQSLFLAAPVAIQRRLLQRALTSLQTDQQPLPFRHLEALRSFIATCRPAQRLSLPGNLVAECHQGKRISLSRRAAFSPQTFALPVPGKLLLSALDLCLIVQSLTQVPESRSDPYQAFLDLDRLTLPLTVRFWQPGDRFCPLGSSGSQKLQDFFTNRKIPRTQRPSIPLVVDQRGIVWVVGYQIADTHKMTRTTQRVLHVQCIKLRL